MSYSGIEIVLYRKGYESEINTKVTVFDRWKELALKPDVLRV